MNQPLRVDFGVYEVQLDPLDPNNQITMNGGQVNFAVIQAGELLVIALYEFVLLESILYSAKLKMEYALMFGSLICLAKLSCSIFCLVHVTFNQVIACYFIAQNIIPVAIYCVHVHACMYSFICS